MASLLGESVVFAQQVQLSSDLKETVGISDNGSTWRFQVEASSKIIQKHLESFKPLGSGLERV